MPDEVQYRGYVIEAQSYESDGARWRSRGSGDRQFRSTLVWAPER
jgi:hypothetical protein